MLYSSIYRYVPKISTSESCERQKIRLQEKMSGIKHVDDDPLNGQESTSSNPSESNEINPVDECKFKTVFDLAKIQYEKLFIYFSVKRDSRACRMA